VPDTTGVASSVLFARAVPAANVKAHIVTNAVAPWIFSFDTSI
jgi:hypothetical protein